MVDIKVNTYSANVNSNEKRVIRVYLDVNHTNSEDNTKIASY